MTARSPADRREELVALYRELSCEHACPLAETRTRLVFGMGNADAELMFVGEAPGVEEDRQGRPFVGRAGKLLDRLLEEIGLERGQVFIANVLKCRPPGNRDPLPGEIEECSPYLFRQIELIEPLVVCTLGNFATKLLSGQGTGITRVHGRAQARELGGRTVRLFPLFHPAAALRTDSVLTLLRADFARLPQLLDEVRRTGDSGGAPELAPGLPKTERAAGDRTAEPADASAPVASAKEERVQLDLFGRRQA
ncbi:MAG TPA: uracil-DNA glycosylase [Thermoleophilaceae bacterium]|nr:uracil-DNA glycosylase [Thermoleophilaceae bacterium]